MWAEAKRHSNTETLSASPLGSDKHERIELTCGWIRDSDLAQWSRRTFFPVRLLPIPTPPPKPKHTRQATHRRKGGGGWKDDLDGGNDVSIPPRERSPVRVHVLSHWPDPVAAHKHTHTQQHMIPSLLPVHANTRHPDDAARH